MARVPRNHRTDPTLPDLPAELRRRPDTEGDLPAWRLARRAWESQHGMTVDELWRRELDAARGAGLAAVNAMYAPGRCIEPEDDPRRWPR